MTQTINAIHKHASSQKPVDFSFTWNYDGTTVDWTGRIALPNGGSHSLGGGKLINVPHDQVVQAVTEEVNKLIDDLDIENLLAT
jgi:hypothetical protein